VVRYVGVGRDGDVRTACGGDGTDTRGAGAEGSVGKAQTVEWVQMKMDTLLANR